MWSREWKLALSVILIALVTLVSFLSSLDNDFVNYDDTAHVTQNPLIRDLSWNNIKGIFSTPVISNYVPLVSLSFSLDYALWGLNPFGYHLTNVMLHLINSLLVFALVLRLNNPLLPALVVAVFFGVHPLHVESVAWVTERKDVLSTLFYLGGLLFYLRYREGCQSRFYVLSFAAFVLSLLAKPMAVTLPLIMFLCDYLSARSWSTRALLEKVPFLGMSALFSVYTAWAHQYGAPGGFYALYVSNLGDNLLIACWGLIFYLGKTFMPVQLSAFYPYPAEISLRLPTFFLPPILLLALAAGVWFSQRYTRKVIFGSLFFLLTLLPVLNVVQFHMLAAADRYMYIPSIGIFYLAGVAFQRIYFWKIHWEKTKKVSLMVLLGVIVTTLGTLTWQRSNVWQDSETLWLSVLKNDPGVPVVHNNLGNVYLKKGRMDAAIAEYKKAISLNPNDASLYNNLGAAYLKKGRLDAAIAEYRKAISLNPADALAYINLGNTYSSKGRLDAAIAEYRKAISLNPDYALAHNNLGNAYLGKGETDAAIAEYRKTISLNPADALAHYNLGVAYGGKGKLDAAIAEYQKTTSLDPTNALAHTNLGIIYARKGELDAAVAEYKKAISLNPAGAVAHYNLGIIHEGTGKPDAAIFEYKRAVSLSPQRKVFYYKLASALYVQGRHEESFSVLEKVLALFPGDGTATEMLREYRKAGLPTRKSR